jgi:hypothetical protein
VLTIITAVKRKDENEKDKIFIESNGWCTMAVLARKQDFAKVP